MVDENWVISTGKLLFTVNRDKFTGIEEAWVDVDNNSRYDWQEQILNSLRGETGPFLTDDRGNHYTIDTPGSVKLELEEWNELRLLLRGEGPLKLKRAGNGGKDAPAELGRCVIRIEAYAGQPFLRVQYVFVLTQHAANSVISAYGVKERMDFGTRFDALFGMEGFEPTPIRTLGDTYMMALGPGTCVARSEGPRKRLELAAETTEGWVCGHAGNRGFAITLRDMQDLYPKSFEMQRSGTLAVYFWPPQGDEALRPDVANPDRRTVGGLGFAHQGRLLNLRVPTSFSQGLKDHHGLKEFDTVRQMSVSDATGIAPQYDLLFYFYKGEQQAEEIRGISRAFNMRPHAAQDRASLAASGVLPEMLSESRAKRAVAGVARLLALEDRTPQLGDFNFLDLHRAWNRTENRWSLDAPWMSTQADLPAALWVLYAQTADPTVFHAARRNLRHILSVDVCHAATGEQEQSTDPRLRKIVGGFGGMSSAVHWQSACNVNNHCARLRGLALAYYLTGDRSALDTIGLWRDALDDYGYPAAGLDGAAFLGNLWTLLELEYDPIVHERLARCVPFFEKRPADVADADEWVDGLRYYAYQSGDTRVLTPLKALAADAEALDRVKQRVELAGLLRELAAVAEKGAVAEDLALNLDMLEDSFKKAIAEQGTNDHGLTWTRLSAYVFGAADRGEVAKAAAAALKPVPLQDAKAAKPASGQGVTGGKPEATAADEGAAAPAGGGKPPGQ